MRKHLRAILIVLAAIILIVATVIIYSLIKHGKDTNTSTGITSLLIFDGQNVSVYETEKEAIAKKMENVDAGTDADAEVEADAETDADAEADGKSLSITSRENVHVSAFVGDREVDILHGSDKDYNLDLSGVSDGQTVVVKIEVGGDGTFFGRRLGDIKTYYFALSVVNPNPTLTASSSVPIGVPTGKVFICGDEYMTYASESEAQTAISQTRLTLPRDIASNLVLTAEPDENSNVARIKVSIREVDGFDGYVDWTVCLSKDNGWSDSLDLSSFAGHRVTLALKFENPMAIVNGWQFTSFYVPN